MHDKELLLELEDFLQAHEEIFEVSESWHMIIEERQSLHMLDILNAHQEIENYIKKSGKKTFRETLFSFIDQKGAQDVNIYHKAGLDRRHFSKIRSNPEYRPGKNTVIALAFSLKLNTQQCEELLNTAGYTLSRSQKFDLIVRFFLEKPLHDIHIVNGVLVEYKQKTLTGVLE